MKTAARNTAALPIEDWLIIVDPHLQSYAKAFAEYGFEDTDMLTGATKVDLEEAFEELKVKPFHRKLIKKAFLELQARRQRR
jgi:hypothetical protein